MNLPTFDEVMQLTSTISNEHILQVVECQEMYNVLCSLPDGSTIVEIGCDEGRSSSIIFQLASAKNFTTIHIDPWRWFPERGGRWLDMMNARCAYHPFVLLRMTTEEASAHIQRLTPDGIDLVFVDGSHDQPLIKIDLAVATRVKPGGFLTAHDYPSGGVSEEVDNFVANGNWTKHAQAYGFGVWRKD